MEGMLDHYTDPSLIIRNGEKMYVPSLSEIEPIHFLKFDSLESFHTLSWPSRKVSTTCRLKLITRTDYHVDLHGYKINPRKVLLKVLDSIVDLKDKDDIVLLKVVVKGNKPLSYEYDMTAYKEREKYISAMARTISTVAQLIANGTITKRGVLPPEQVVPGDVYIEQINKREVNIVEVENKNIQVRNVKLS